MFSFLTMLAIWFLFGLSCAWVADSKGRRGDVWFLLGFLLGPVALLVVILLPPVEAMPGSPDAREPAPADEPIITDHMAQCLADRLRARQSHRN